MYKDGKQYDKFILNGKTYDKFYLNNKQYGGGYVPFATPILDLDFQNNFIDKSPSGLPIVQGQGLPTFGLSGRKAGEYCAIFNGVQSIKTNINLPLNSDKVCVKFWLKTTQSVISVIYELSQRFVNNNAFAFYMAQPNGKVSSGDHVTGGYDLVHTINAVNDNTWKHIVCVINRSLSTNKNKIYINGVSSFVQDSIDNKSNNGNFINNILFIGQRAGTSLGFNGSLAKYQVFNQAPTDAQAMEMYQNDL